VHRAVGSGSGFCVAPRREPQADLTRVLDSLRVLHEKHAFFPPIRGLSTMASTESPQSQAKASISANELAERRRSPGEGGKPDQTKPAPRGQPNKPNAQPTNPRGAGGSPAEWTGPAPENTNTTKTRHAPSPQDHPQSHPPQIKRRGVGESALSAEQVKCTLMSSRETGNSSLTSTEKRCANECNERSGSAQADS
jgi:hypothetical protein